MNWLWAVMSWCKSERVRPVWWFLILTPLTGLLGVYVSPDFGNIALALLGASFLTVWCIIDSRHSNCQFSQRFAIGVFAVAIVFFPAYLLKSRGPRGLLLLIPAILVIGIGNQFSRLAEVVVWCLVP